MLDEFIFFKKRAVYTLFYAGSYSQDIGLCLPWLRTLQILLKVSSNHFSNFSILK